MTTTGGPAALRGYRLQTLYAAHQLVVAGAGQARLEGEEDIDLLHANGSEYVQVKGYSHPLVLSDLIERRHGGSVAGFLSRASKVLEADSSARFTLASFGLIGPELANAWADEGAPRNSVLRKLVERYDISNGPLLLQQVRLVACDEAAMASELRAQLLTSIAGGEPETSLEILFYWLHRQSELQAQVDKPGLLAKLAAAGRFLSERATYHSEWFVSIRPLEARTGNADRLADQFYLGMDARYDHIVAGVDVPRPSQLRRIREAFSSRDIVIVRGASGQGKSALAYRYIRDHVPTALAYEVRDIRDLGRAQRISSALLGHVRAMEVPLFVYLDAQPRDQGWIDVVRSLAAADGVRVLVTVREEAWQMAESRLARLDHVEVALSFSEDEAREVFDQLSSHRQPHHFVSFEEAWRRFDSDGPLLEFVYFITKNQKLRARLDEQVAALREELVPSELRFIRAAAVATAGSARISASSLGRQINVPDVQKLVARLRNEYILRAEDDHWLEALHPVRSMMLCSILTDEALEPWHLHATTAVHHIDERDLEFFLLHAFDRGSAARSAVAAELATLTVATWTGCGGVLRALLWLGVREHVDAHADVVEAMRALLGSGWWIIVGWDVSGLRERTGLDIKFEDLPFVPEGKRLAIQKLKQVCAGVERSDFAAGKEWLSRAATLALEQPADEQAWSMLAEVAFWTDHWQLREAASGFERIDLTPAEDLPVAVQADLVSAIEPVLGPTHEGLTVLRAAANSQMRSHARAVVLEDDGSVIRAHFIVRESWLTATPATEPRLCGQIDGTVHEQKLDCLNLLVDLHSRRDKFATQGYGHRRIIRSIGGYDESQSEVERALFPPRYLVRVNQLFRGLVDLRYRPATWHEHAEAVVQARSQASELLNWIAEAGWRSSLRKRTGINHDAWMDLHSRLSEPPLLPLSAVDPWGISAEGKAMHASDAGYRSLERSVAIWKHTKYWGVLRDVFNGLSMFIANAWPVIQGQSQDRQSLRVAEQQLSFSLEKLPEMQSLFTERFETICGANQLDSLNGDELRSLQSCWEFWHALAYGGATQKGKKNRAPARDIAERERRTLGRLDRLLRNAGDASTTLRRVPPVGGPAGWALHIQADVREPLAIWDARAAAIDAVQRALKPRDHLDRRLLNQRWSTICVIPTVAGRALDRRGWSFPPVLIAAGNDLQKSMSTLLLQDIDSDAWPGSIECWPSGEATHLLGKLTFATEQLALALYRLVDFKDLPELDDQGGTILQRELANIGNRVSNTVSNASDLYGALIDSMERSDGSYPEDFAAAAKEFGEALLRSTDIEAGEYTLTLETCEHWLSDLKQRGMVNLEILRLIVWQEVIQASTAPDAAPAE